MNTHHSSYIVLMDLDSPIDLTGHILSLDNLYQEPQLPGQPIPFNCPLCRYAVAAGQKTFATGIRKWSKHLTDFPTPKFKTIDWEQQWRMVLMDIYSHLCLTDVSVKIALI